MEGVMTLLNIGQVAKQTGVTVETVRFYEKKNLIAAPQRSDAGYRQYPPETVKRVRFIQNAKEVGFTLKDIGELLSLSQKPGTSCAGINMHATQKMKEGNQKIHDLKRIRNALGHMIMKCNFRRDLSGCPILDELEPDDT
jgi:MerR family mercuric resistance operon transcriptional regulator